MKRWRVLVVAGSLLGTGCNAGDAAPEAVDPPDPASTTIPESSDRADDHADSTTDVSESTPTSEVMDDTPAWTRLEELRRDPAVDELDVALAEFSALFAPVPGGPVVAGDDRLLGTATHVLDDLERLRDRLTAEQQAFIDERVDAVFGNTAAIHEFTLYPEAAAVRGFRSPVAPEVELAIRAVADSLVSVMGGPPLKVQVVVVDGSSLGTAGAQTIWLGPTSPIRRDYADDGLDVDCVMQIRDQPTGTTEFRGIVVHELVHCWHFTRIGLDGERMRAVGDWMKEGIAAYVGEQVGGTTRFSEEWWTAYTVPQFDVDGAWPLYARSYDAIGFWARIAEEGDIWDAIRAAVDASPGDAAMFNAAVADLGEGVSWLAAGTVQRAAWGDDWTADGPNMPDRARRTKTHQVIERNDIALSEGAGHQRNHEISVAAIGAADGSVLTLRGQGYGVIRIDPDDIVMRGTLDQDWCLGTCECPDGTPAYPAERIRPGDVELTASLVGQAAETTTLNVAVHRFDPDTADCEEPPPAPTTQPASEGSIIGTWRARPDAIGDMFERASVFGADAPPLEVAGVGGDLLMVFDEGGTGTLMYHDVTLLLSDSPMSDLTINGGGPFTWENVDGRVVIDASDYTISVTSTALGEPLTIASSDLPGGGTSSFVAAQDGDELAVTAVDGTVGEVFFPVNWTRA